MSINTNGKLFRKFTVSEVFTNYIYELMKQGKRFIVFPDNNQILIEDEVDEFYNIHGIVNQFERLMYHQYRNEGYVVHYSDAPTTVTIPLGLLEKSYEDFIQQCEADVNYRMG